MAAMACASATLGIETVDERDTQPLQEAAGHELPLEFALGDEGMVARQRRHQHQAVEITGVVACEDDRAIRWQMLQALHFHRRARQPQQRAGSLDSKATRARAAPSR
jgi:hypothetical protein